MTKTTSSSVVTVLIGSSNLSKSSANLTVVKTYVMRDDHELHYSSDLQTRTRCEGDGIMWRNQGERRSRGHSQTKREQKWHSVTGTCTMVRDLCESTAIPSNSSNQSDISLGSVTMMTSTMTLIPEIHGYFHIPTRHTPTKTHRLSISLNSPSTIIYIKINL